MLRNNAENVAYQAEKLLEDNKEKIPDDLKQEVEAKVTEVREALNAEDSGRTKEAMDDLQESLQKAGQLVYSESGESPEHGEPHSQQGDGASGGEKPDETVEGEFREV